MEPVSQKISACLVVYNEEKNIRRCLDSLHGVVDEIIVVHDGECQDKTLEICGEFGAKIFVRPHVGVMEAHLVFAIRQATGSWLMRIDADEFLSAELKLNLKRLVEEGDKNKISAYSFYWPNYHQDGRFSGKERKTILFKKIDFFWLSIPHWAWQTRGRLEASSYILGHLSKDNSAIHWGGLNECAMIQAKCILKDFKDLDNFQATENDWLSAYSFSRRYAGLLFFPFFKFFKSFFEALVDGLGPEEAWRRGRYNYYLGYSLYTLIHRR